MPSRPPYHGDFRRGSQTQNTPVQSSSSQSTSQNFPIDPSSAHQTDNQRRLRQLQDLVAMIRRHILELAEVHFSAEAIAQLIDRHERELAELDACYNTEFTNADTRRREERSRTPPPPPPSPSLSPDDEDTRRRRERSEAPPAAEEDERRRRERAQAPPPLAAFFGQGSNDLDIVNSELLERREGDVARFALGNVTNFESGLAYWGSGLGGSENQRPSRV